MKRSSELEADVLLREGEAEGIRCRLAGDTRARFVVLSSTLRFGVVEGYCAW